MSAAAPTLTDGPGLTPRDLSAFKGSPLAETAWIEGAAIYRDRWVDARRRGDVAEKRAEAAERRADRIAGFAVTAGTIAVVVSVVWAAVRAAGWAE